jgi:DNA-binding NtrC family response regulator
VCSSDLAQHDWPGNVRELRNVVERGAALAVGLLIEVEDLRLRPAAPSPLAAPVAPVAPVAPAAEPPTLAARFAALDVTERELVETALSSAAGNVSEAARLLGITRIKMKRRLDRYASATPDPDD